MLRQDLGFDDQNRIAELQRLNRHELKKHYWQLATPTIHDLSGEYDAELLDQGDRVCEFLIRRVFASRGPWVGKAFRPLPDGSGEGYNAFGTVENRKPLLPMDTYIDHSLIVPGYSYILDYRAKNRGPIRWLRGELRMVSENILLGMGVFGLWSQRLRKLRRVIPFLLVQSDRLYLDNKVCTAAEQVVGGCDSAAKGQLECGRPTQLIHSLPEQTRTARKSHKRQSMPIG